MIKAKVRDTLLNPLINENPVTLQVLGICSALAITNSLYSALIMILALTTVMAYANVSISLIRHHLPDSVRLIMQLTVIATGVIIVDEVIKAYLPETAKTLSVFIGLIVTNCIVLGRTETFAAHNNVGYSLLDAIGNGLGYSLVLITVAIIRELFGTGSLMGIEVFRITTNGGWYDPNALLLLPPSAFFIIGFLIWAIRSWKTDQVESSEFNSISFDNEDFD